VYLDRESQPPFDGLYENEGLSEDCGLYEDMHMACIRIRVMRLMSDSAYVYAYGRLYIYGPYALLIDQSINKSFQHPK